MTKNTISLDSLSPLTEAQRGNLHALAAQPEKEIDCREIPEVSDVQWRRVHRTEFCRSVKHQITARIDVDVLEWLKAGGKGYQSRINAILRREMLSEKKQR